MKKLAVTEVFYSLQGEGGRSGEPSVFVRFQGCNLRCDIGEPSDVSPGNFACDTEWSSGRLLPFDELLAWVTREAGLCRWIVFTGGEPALQLDKDGVRAFQDAGFRCAIETNGTVDVSGLGLDWICVSPKIAEHAVRQLTAHEVKYVRHYGQGIPKPTCRADLQYISPAFGPDGTLAHRDLLWCIDLVKANPAWRLSVQQHKQWRVR